MFRVWPEPIGPLPEPGDNKLRDPHCDRGPSGDQLRSMVRGLLVSEFRGRNNSEWTVIQPNQPIQFPRSRLPDRNNFRNTRHPSGTKNYRGWFLKGAGSRGSNMVDSLTGAGDPSAYANASG